MEYNPQNTGDMNIAPDSHQQHGASDVEGQYELILNWYKVNGKNLLDEEILTRLQIDTLLEILGNPIWNDIYHCWAVEPKHMPALQPYSQHQFDADKFTYFIEAYHTKY